MFGAADMATFFYRQHYDKVIGPALSDEQKRDIIKRMSDLTLYEPFQFTGKDYTSRFPELKPYVNTEISGLYILAIMEGISHDLGLGVREGSRFPSLPRRREVRVRSYPRRTVRRP